MSLVSVKFKMGPLDSFATSWSCLQYLTRITASLRTILPWRRTKLLLKPRLQHPRCTSIVYTLAEASVFVSHKFFSSQEKRIGLVVL